MIRSCGSQRNVGVRVQCHVDAAAILCPVQTLLIGIDRELGLGRGIVTAIDVGGRVARGADREPRLVTADTQRRARGRCPEDALQEETQHSEADR